MDRLTKVINGRVVFPEELVGVTMTPDNDTMYRILNRLAAYEDTGLDPQDIISAVDMGKIACALHELNAYKDIGSIEHLRELIQAEQDGRLVVLPCKVGDTVYQVDYMTHSEALKSGVPQSKDPYQNRKYARKRAEYLPLIVREKKMVKSLFREFGKTVFLTREEAEAALKGGEG